MKVFKKNRILLYSWLPTGSYHKKLAILEKKSSKSGEFGPLFSFHEVTNGPNIG
jgi:hypothetical protein